MNWIALVSIIFTFSNIKRENFQKSLAVSMMTLEPELRSQDCFFVPKSPLKRVETAVFAQLLDHMIDTQ